MNCNNCGAKINGDERVCPNCGAFIDDSSGYTLLAADDRIDDFYSDDVKPKRRLSFFALLVIIAVVSAAGSFLFFGVLQPWLGSSPDIGLSSGCGIINESEKIVYTAMGNSNDVEYIESVKLYNGTELISENYEYTKNINSTLRSVFFYTDSLELEEGKEYTLTFNIALRFENGRRYTYQQEATVSAEITENASDIIFDHSMNTLEGGEAEEETQTEEESSAVQTEAQSNEFIFDGYWYTVPVTDASSKSIDAYKFNSDGTYTVTHYTQQGNAAWSAAADTGSYTFENGYITFAGSAVHIKIDYSSSALSVEGSGAFDGAMTARVHNSLVNAQDFFNQ